MGVYQRRKGGFAEATDACQDEGVDVGLGETDVYVLNDGFALLDGMRVSGWRSADDAAAGRERYGRYWSRRNGRGGSCMSG